MFICVFMLFMFICMFISDGHWMFMCMFMLYVLIHSRRPGEPADLYRAPRIITIATVSIMCTITISIIVIIIFSSSSSSSSSSISIPPPSRAERDFYARVRLAQPGSAEGRPVEVQVGSVICQGQSRDSHEDRIFAPSRVSQAIV